MADRFWDKVNRDGPMSHLGTRCWVWTAARTKAGYGAFRVAGKTVYAHRASWEEANGSIPPKLDHRCHYEPCVRPDHLRPATNKQNMENRSGLDENNTSGVRGVWWNHGAWVAEVKHGGRRIYVGRFSTIEKAEAAVVAKRNELFTHNDLDRLAYAADAGSRPTGLRVSEE